jgi:hypothetical protein
MEDLHAKKLVAALAAAYPTNKLDDDSIRVYTRMLLDLDYDAANAAIARLVATCKFPPSIAEIREATLAMVNGEVRAGGEAWGDVLRAIGRYGRNRLPGQDFKLEDPVVAECVAALKWRELCDSENQEADRARFIQLYDRLATQRRKAEASEGLPAVQRYRALQEKRKRELESGEAQPIGKLLVLPTGGER